MKPAENGSSFFVFRLPNYTAWKALAPFTRDTEEGGDLIPAPGGLPFMCFAVQTAEKKIMLVIPFKTADASPRCYLEASEHLRCWRWLHARLLELAPGSVARDYQLDHTLFVPHVLGFQRFAFRDGPALEAWRIPQDAKAGDVPLTALVDSRP
jgi:hypothetical protein